MGAPCPGPTATTPRVYSGSCPGRVRSLKDGAPPPWLWCPWPRPPPPPPLRDDEFLCIDEYMLCVHDLDVYCFVKKNAVVGLVLWMRLVSGQRNEEKNKAGESKNECNL